MNIKPTRILNSIQILRGLAALSVVLYHYGFYLPLANGSAAARPFAWGGIGVDLFFVISGFIMIVVTKDYSSGFSESKKFIINRLSRILPVYYVILLIAFLTNGAMSTFHYDEKVINFISALTLTPYMHDTAPMYILSDGLFNVRWTLSYEIYFYLAFSVSLLFVKKHIPLILWFAAPIAICFITGESISFSTKGYAFSNVFIEFLTNPILLEFGMGVVAGSLYLRLTKKNYTPNILVISIISILIVIGIGTNLLTMYSLLSGLAFSILVLTLTLCEKYFQSPWLSFLVYLGNISFSLYLIHNPLASFLSKKVEKYFPDVMHSAFGVIVMLLTAVIVAHISYRYLEIRLSRYTKNKLESLFIRKSSQPKPL